MQESIFIEVNGERKEMPTGTSLAELMVMLRGSDTNLFGIAACVNGEVIPQPEWRNTALAPDDKVELLQAFQGG